jgi:ankyrin repeat protein
VNTRDRNNNTPLLIATKLGKIQAIKRLLKEATINMNSLNDAGETPLIAAYGANYINMVLQLLNTSAITII